MQTLTKPKPKILNTSHKEKEKKMDQTLIIRVVSGVLFVIVLFVLIQRRRTRVK